MPNFRGRHGASSPSDLSCLLEGGGASVRSRGRARESPPLRIPNDAGVGADGGRGRGQPASVASRPAITCGGMQIGPCAGGAEPAGLRTRAGMRQGTAPDHVACAASAGGASPWRVPKRRPPVVLRSRGAPAGMSAVSTPPAAGQNPARRGAHRSCAQGSRAAHPQGDRAVPVLE